MNVDAVLVWPAVGIVTLILAVAGLAHGTMGFGFPVISTPMVALIADVQTAVIATLFPNVVVNVVSVVRGGEWRESIAKYWPVAAWVFVGTIIGTRVLLVANPGPIKLLLAAMIVVYLQQARLRAIDWTWVRRHPRIAAAVFGTLGGFLSGSVNVALPPLVIYFMSLELPAVAMTQILNLCFLVGRSTQAVAFGVSGKVGLTTLVGTWPLAIVAVVAVFTGMRLQRSLRPETYTAALRVTLGIMAALLVTQVVLQQR